MIAIVTPAPYSDSWTSSTESITTKFSVGTRAKSGFHFDVPGSVANLTHAGIPWLRFIRERVGDRVYFWPFDGWTVPAGESAVVEVYPALCSHGFQRDGRDSHERDAHPTAEWLRGNDQDGNFGGFSAQV